ncbi:MAG: gamma-butyrobetaine hydroxylase-like domain-containing protein [Aestuariivirgaceae bacterium]
MNNQPTEIWPTEVRAKPGGTHLAISFENGEAYEMPAEFLRVESPSAEVKGHGKGQEVTVPGKRNVRIANLEPIGNYAVRIVFDDNHSTGLYSWSLLLRLGREQEELWLAYLDNLEAQGLSRD